MGSNNSKTGRERLEEMKTSLTNTLLRQTPTPPPQNEPSPSPEEVAAAEAVVAATEQVTMALLKLG